MSRPLRSGHSTSLLRARLLRIAKQLSAEVAGPVRTSEAVTAPVRTNAGMLFLRSVPQSAAEAVAGHLRSPGYRAPRLFDVHCHPDGDVEVWEHIDAQPGGVGHVGRAVAAFEQTPVPDGQLPQMLTAIAGIDIAAAEALYGVERTQALVRVADTGWDEWLAGDRPTGWIHTDLQSSNTALDSDGRIVVWDLTSSRVGPLGLDLAGIIFAQRWVSSTPASVEANLRAYHRAGGQTQTDSGLIALERTYAARMALHDAALPAVAYPGVAGRMMGWLRTLLDGSDEPWHGFSDLTYG